MCQKIQDHEDVHAHDQANMMMSNIVKLGKFSYELEEKREQSLIAQSNQMLTAFSVFSVALYMALPIIISVNTALANQVLFCAGIVSLALISSLILAISCLFLIAIGIVVFSVFAIIFSNL